MDNMIQDLGFRIQGSELGMQDPGCRMQDPRFKLRDS
jgi:hypothetical protein